MDLPLQRNYTGLEGKEVFPIIEDEKEETMDVGENRQIPRRSSLRNSLQPKPQLCTPPKENFIKTFKAEEVVNELTHQLLGSIKSEFQKEKLKLQSKTKKGENKENFHRNTAAVARLSTEKLHGGIVNPLTKQKIKERKNIEKNKPRKAKITDFVKFNFGTNGVLKIRKTPEKKTQSPRDKKRQPLKHKVNKYLQDSTESLEDKRRKQIG